MSKSWPVTLSAGDQNYIVQRPSTKTVWKLYIKYQSIIESLAAIAQESESRYDSIDDIIEIADELLSFCMLQDGSDVYKIDLDRFDMGDKTPFIIAGEIADLLFADFLEESLNSETQPLEEIFKPLHRLSAQQNDSPPTPPTTN